MRRCLRKSLLSAALALTLSAVPVLSYAQTFWVLGADGLWTNTSAWSSAPSLPDAFSDAVNNTAFTVTLNTNASISNYTSTGKFVLWNILSGAILLRGTKVKVSNELKVAGGGANFLTIEGDPLTTLAFDGNGNNYLQNVDLTGTLSVTGGFARSFGLNRIRGAVTVDGLDFRVQDGSTVAITSTGSLAGEGVISRVNGNTFFTNAGTVTATGGDLFLEAWQGSGDGTVRGSTGSTLRIRGTYTGTGTTAKVLKNGGDVAVEGGALIGDFAQLEATFNGDGNNYIQGVNSNGTAQLSGGYSRAFGTSTFKGATSFTGLDLRIQDGSTVKVSSTGSLTGYGVISRENANTFFTNDGQVTAEGGALYLDAWQGGGSGTLRSDGTSPLILRGTYTGSGDAKVLLNGGEVVVQGGAYLGQFHTLQSLFNGDGSNYVSGITIANGGSLSQGYTRAFGTNTFNGPVTIEDTDFRVHDGANLTIGATGSLTGKGSITRVNSNTFLVNNGVITASGGALFLDPWQGSGSGILKGSNTGNLILRGKYSGTSSTTAETLHNGGLVQVQGGGISGSFKTLQLSFNGDGNNFVDEATVSGGADLAGGYTRAFGTTTLDGVSSINGLDFRLHDAAKLKVGSAGSLVGTGVLSRVNGNTFLVNDGLVKASGGDLYIDPWQGWGVGTFKGSATGNVVLRGNFNGNAGGASSIANGGQVRVEGGAISGEWNASDLTFNGDGSNALGSYVLLAGGTGTWNGGFSNLYGSVKVHGTLNHDSLTTRLLDGAHLEVKPGGVLNASGATQRVNSNTYFTNHGTLKTTGNYYLGAFSSNWIGTQDVPAGTSLQWDSYVAQNAGTTTVGGTLNNTGPFAFTLNAGILKGTGTVNGSVNNVGGTIAPGNSPGLLTVGGNLTQGSTSTLDIEILALAGSSFDRLSVGGTATLDGTLNVVTLPGAVWGVGDTFRILTASSRVGTFAIGPNPSQWSVVYGSNYVDLVALQAVPEPTSVVALGVGALALMRRRRNSKSNQA